MSVCMSSLLAFVLIMLSPMPWSYHVSRKCSQPSISLDYSLGALIDNPKICDSSVDLGHTGKMFTMLGGNVDNYIFRGYFRGYRPPIDPYCVS